MSRNEEILLIIFQKKRENKTKTIVATNQLSPIFLCFCNMLCIVTVPITLNIAKLKLKVLISIHGRSFDLISVILQRKRISKQWKQTFLSTKHTSYCHHKNSMCHIVVIVFLNISENAFIYLYTNGHKKIIPKFDLHMLIHDTM